MSQASLTNKRIIVGITGGIAAYKSAELVRRLRDANADVRVVMTRAAQEFITPLTLQALSGNPVHTQLLDTAAEAAMGHIELARWADALIVAPASADFIAKMARGQADDLLSTLILAIDAPIAVAPAMNQAMYRDPATQANLALLAERQVAVFGPAEGSQACGDTGPGRLLEADQLAAAVAGLFHSGSLASLKVLVSAGPTREAIDPVRYISNHSSGKMGYALAAAAAEAGAQTTLVSGPVALACPERVNRISVESAADMLSACQQHQQCDIFIATAAVADYRPVDPAGQKIKKTAATMSIELARNPDILHALAQLDGGPFTVGFAAETDQVIAYARGKLERKGLDMIVANDVADTSIGFNSDDNAVTVITAEGEQALPRASKQQLARTLVEAIAKAYKQR